MHYTYVFKSESKKEKVFIINHRAGPKSMQSEKVTFGKPSFQTRVASFFTKYLKTFIHIYKELAITKFDNT